MQSNHTQRNVSSVHLAHMGRRRLEAAKRLNHCVSGESKSQKLETKTMMILLSQKRVKHLQEVVLNRPWNPDSLQVFQGISTAFQEWPHSMHSLPRRPRDSLWGHDFFWKPSGGYRRKSLSKTIVHIIDASCRPPPTPPFFVLGGFCGPIWHHVGISYSRYSHVGPILGPFSAIRGHVEGKLGYARSCWNYVGLRWPMWGHADVFASLNVQGFWKWPCLGILKPGWHHFGVNCG